MIINTRPIERGHSLLGHLDSGVIACPMLESHAMPWPASALTRADAIIVTSQTAVEMTANHIQSRDIPVYAVGSATAGVASRMGFSNVVYANGTAAHLLEIIDEADFEAGVYLSARHVSRDLAEARPDKIQRHIVYEMRPAQHLSAAAAKLMVSGRRFFVPFYSPRTLEVFEALVLRDGLAPCLTNGTAVLIHSRLQSAMKLKWRDVYISARPDNESIVSALGLAA